MENYPEKTCSLDRLVTQPNLVTAAVEGKKTQQRRNGVYGYPGETFELAGVRFIITELVHQRLGDMIDADAKAEGFPDINTYRDIISKMHGGMKLNDDGKVWTHTFAKVMD